MKSVSDFFKKRAQKIASLGDIQAVIYQDHNPSLAYERNIAEKNKLLPLMKLDGTQRILDIGCGTGRWAHDLLELCSWYHGIDSCDEFIEYASQKFKDQKNTKFSVSLASSFSLGSLGEEKKFDQIICSGILMYLNDTELNDTVKCISSSLNNNGFLLLREPLGINQRLTISEHYSTEMSQNYSAIYRTFDELTKTFMPLVSNNDLAIVEHGNVYDDKKLNNRKDTIQKWILFKKAH